MQIILFLILLILVKGARYNKTQGSLQVDKLLSDPNVNKLLKFLDFI